MLHDSPSSICFLQPSSSLFGGPPSDRLASISFYDEDTITRIATDVGQLVSPK